MSEAESSGHQDNIVEGFPKECALKRITIRDLFESTTDDGEKAVDFEYKDGSSYTLFVNGEGRVRRIIQPRISTNDKSWTSWKPDQELEQYTALLEKLGDDILAADLDDERYGVVLSLKPAL